MYAIKKNTVLTLGKSLKNAAYFQNAGVKCCLHQGYHSGIFRYNPNIFNRLVKVVPKRFHQRRGPLEVQDRRVSRIWYHKFHDNDQKKVITWCEGLLKIGT